MPESEAPSPDSPDYHPAIERNFYTEGPDIGRTKDTETAKKMAKEEDDSREALRHQPYPDAYATRAAEELDFQQRRTVVESDPELRKLNAEAYGPGDLNAAERTSLRHEADQTHYQIEDDYTKLQKAQSDHDAELLRAAKDKEADESRDNRSTQTPDTPR